jgi:hypothetical protein
MVYVYTIGVVVLFGVMLWLASTRKYQVGRPMFGVFVGLTLCMALVMRELFVPDLPWWSVVFLTVVVGVSGYVRYYAMSRK